MKHKNTFETQKYYWKRKNTKHFGTYRSTLVAQKWNLATSHRHAWCSYPLRSPSQVCILLLPRGIIIFFFVRGTISPFYGKSCNRGVIFKTFLGGSTWFTRIQFNRRCNTVSLFFKHVFTRIQFNHRCNAGCLFCKHGIKEASVEEKKCHCDKKYEAQAAQSRLG